MKLLVCFDVDGTLETSGGPVTLMMLARLQAMPNLFVTIVSPSAAAPPGFERALPNGGGSRRDNLLAAKFSHPADLYLYVSNNGDQAEAIAAGFLYVDHIDFATALAAAEVPVGTGSS
ncbi:MAG: hypothetical protein ACHQC8_02405 [Solirubrobacterales bacterium]